MEQKIGKDTVHDIVIKMSPEVEQFIKSFHATIHRNGTEVYYGQFSYTRTENMESGTYKLTPIEEQRNIRRKQWKITSK